MQFVINNWYLFLALAVVLFMLLSGPLRQLAHGVRNVAGSRAVQLVNHNTGIMLDVREPAEFQAGHIPNAINVPLAHLEGRLKELERYKERPVIVCCRSGHRSAGAAVLLRKRGFASVYNLSGGIIAWQNEHLPVES